MEDICFWSIGDGDFALMLQELVNSFRRVGMENEFIAFSDRPIKGAVTKLVPDFGKKRNLLKFDFLKMLASLPYRAFVFLDADSLFVRKAPPLEMLLEDSPVHAFLECDCTYPATRRSWWGCPLEEYVKLMRECGIVSTGVYNVNAGFFMVEKKAIELVCGLVDAFWQHALMRGYLFTEEPPLAYAVQMLCSDPERHLLSNHFDIWASDWTAQFGNKLPEGKPWMFKDWMREGEYMINPAIIHVVKSKKLLISKYNS